MCRLPSSLPLVAGLPRRLRPNLLRILSCFHSWPACSPLSPHVAVDRLLAHGLLTPCSAPAHDLLRAPFPPEQPLHLAPLPPRELAALSRAPAPGHRVLLRLVGPVRSVVPGRVALSLAADRRCRAAQHPADLSAAVPRLKHVGHGVSFAVGELAIHLSASPSCRLRKLSVLPTLPPHLLKVLHLVCQTAAPNLSIERTGLSQLRWPKPAAHVGR